MAVELSYSESVCYELEQELKPIFNFLEYHQEPFKIGLNCSFKQFSLYFPNIKRADLIKFFDYCEENPTNTLKVLNILNEDLTQ